MTEYRYSAGEKLPIEVLVFEMDPAHVEEYLAIDHEIWTLGEASLPAVHSHRQSKIQTDFLRHWKSKGLNIKQCNIQLR